MIGNETQGREGKNVGREALVLDAPNETYIFRIKASRDYVHDTVSDPGIMRWGTR